MESVKIQSFQIAPRGIPCWVCKSPETGSSAALSSRLCVLFGFLCCLLVHFILKLKTNPAFFLMPLSKAQYVK